MAATVAAAEAVAAENHICRACLFGRDTRARVTRVIWAAQLQHWQNRGPAWSDLNRNSAMQDGQVWSARWRRRGCGLRRRRHCGCGNCGSGLSNTHTPSLSQSTSTATPPASSDVFIHFGKWHKLNKIYALATFACPCPCPACCQLWVSPVATHMNAKPRTGNQTQRERPKVCECQMKEFPERRGVC